MADFGSLKCVEAALILSTRHSREIDTYLFDLLVPCAEQFLGSKVTTRRLSADGQVHYSTIDGGLHLNAGQVPRFTRHPAAAFDLIQLVLPGAFWLAARGPLSESEKLHGCVITFGPDDILGKGEHDDLCHAILLSLLNALINQANARAAALIGAAQPAATNG